MANMFTHAVERRTIMYKSHTSCRSMVRAVRQLSLVPAALLCAGTAFIFAACDFFTPTWNKPVGAWFEKYTNEAAIDRHEFSAPTYADKDGNICIGSEADCTVTFYLRNPKNYNLAPSFTSNTSVPANSVLVIQDASDRSIIRMTLPQSFLLACEKNNKDEERNISPAIHIARHENGTKIREFADYSFNLFANSKPPELLDPTVLKNTKDPSNPSFVVAFNVPASADSFRVHKDIVKLTISGGRHNRTWEYSVAPPQTANGSFIFIKTGNAPYLLTLHNPAWAAIDGKTFTPGGGGSFYLETGEYVNGTVAYTLTLTDAAGLASSVQARSCIGSNVQAKSVTIEGADNNAAVLYGRTSTTSVLTIAATVPVPLKDLTITKGYPGVTINSTAAATMNGCIRNNTASSGGGGVAVGKKFTMNGGI